jgi:hypothetical protein
MFRVAYILLTVAGILACPFVCMAKVGAHGAPAEQRSGCSCCQHWQNSPDESDSGTGPVGSQPCGPAHPKDCDCTCLCKGAPHTEGDGKFSLEEQTMRDVWLDFSLAAQADAGSRSLRCSADAPPPPKLGSGRLISLALASLLL